MKINNFIRIFPFIVLFTPNRKFKKSKIKKELLLLKISLILCKNDRKSQNLIKI